MEPELRAQVVLEILGWLEGVQDPATRTFIVRNLHGVKSPEIKAPLLELLERDADATVREEAAETLDDYLDDAQVRAALEQAAATDAEPSVRKQAAAALIKAALGG
jgi:HEAT repeat protein